MAMKVALMLIAGLLIGNAAVIADGTTPKARKDSQASSTAAQENVVVTIAPEAKLKILAVETAQGKKIKLEMPGVTIEAARLSVKSEGKITEMRVCADGGIEMRKYQDGNRAAQPSKPPQQTSIPPFTPVPALPAPAPSVPLMSPLTVAPVNTCPAPPP